MDTIQYFLPLPKSGFHYAALTVQRSTCLCLPSAGIRGVCHHHCLANIQNIVTALQYWDLVKVVRVIQTSVFTWSNNKEERISTLHCELLRTVVYVN